ncbi:YhcN/YlaJ family sporulation lipoprotein [Bacillota bacterium Meth-B3]|nr:YhcN/YlaJ family sporulation lipoprotein [Christensenellaceae bacterium]MEA5065320.1 YhcN/YlaJ family sporulation lipoprotein [Eubacteriales bacterium]MEA5068005.1 YhcN/YlaJ family sporulation lipoprotein [Christensenellaceae bacterium]
MVKKMVLPATLILIAALMGGCFNNPPVVPEATVTPMPSVTVGPMPGTTPGAVTGTTPMPGVSGAGSSYNWQTQAAAVESRINMFSEIQDSRVVADGGTALVGVKFNNAYKGELTQRIRDMVAGEVMAVDKQIQVVAVTAEPGDVQKIYALSDQQRAGNTPPDLKQQIDQIARNTTTLR